MGLLPVAEIRDHFKNDLDKSKLSLIEVGKRLGIDSRVLSKFRKGQQVSSKYLTRFWTWHKSGISLKNLVVGDYELVPVQPYPKDVKKKSFKRGPSFDHYSSSKRKINKKRKETLVQKKTNVEEKISKKRFMISNHFGEITISIPEGTKEMNVQFKFQNTK